MRAKRSRIVRPLSYGHDGVLNQLRPPATEPSMLRFDARAALSISAAGNQPSTAAMVETAQSRPTILRLSSPEAEKADGDGHIFENFLDKCCYCKKKIGEKDEVFMYRHFRAFCTPECRDKVIKKDEALERRSDQSAEAMKQCSKVNNERGQISFQI